MEIVATIFIILVKSFSFLNSAVILIVYNRLRYRIVESLNSFRELLNREFTLIGRNLISICITSDAGIVILISYYIEEALSSSQSFYTVNIDLINYSFENINSRYSQRINEIKQILTSFRHLKGVVQIFVHNLQIQVAKFLDITDSRRTSYHILIDGHGISSKQENLAILRVVNTVHDLQDSRIRFTEILFKFIQEQNAISFNTRKELNHRLIMVSHILYDNDGQI